MAWSWWAVPGTLSLVLAWSAAVVVLRTAPRRSLNRRLGLVLLLEGAFSTGIGVLFLVEDHRVASALGIVAVVALAMLPFHYLSFLGVALETPLVAPLRSRRAFWTLCLASVAAAGLVLLFPREFVSAPYHPGWAPWNVQGGRWAVAVAQAYGLTALFALLAALSAYVRTRPGSGARTRAKWFAVAFGVRDIYLGLGHLLYPVARPVPYWGDLLYNPVYAVVYLGFLALLAYGVLRVQLFDIDLKLKFALQHSTVAALIGGAFFVGTELLEGVVPGEGRLLRLLVAGAIVLVLRPVQRLAEGFAGRVMRGVEDTAEYRDARKLEVYRAALEGAVQDGELTPKEQEILSRLRQKLEISPVEAARAENEVLVGMAWRWSGEHPVRG